MTEQRTAPSLPKGERVVTTRAGGRILTHGPSAFAPDDAPGDLGGPDQALDISKLGKDGVAAELARRMAAFRATQMQSGQMQSGQMQGRQMQGRQMQAEAPASRPAAPKPAASAAKPNAPHPFLRAYEMHHNPPQPRIAAQRAAEAPKVQPAKAHPAQETPRVEPTFTRASPDPAPEQPTPRLQRWDEPWLGEAEPALVEERLAAEEAVPTEDAGAEIAAPAYLTQPARPRRSWGRRVMRTAGFAACLGSAAGAAMIWSFHGSAGIARQLSFLGTVEVEVREFTQGLTGAKPAPQPQPVAAGEEATVSSAAAPTQESGDTAPAVATAAPSATASPTPAVSAPQSVSSDFAAPDLAESAQPAPSPAQSESAAPEPAAPEPSASALASAAPQDANGPQDAPANAEDDPAYLVAKPFEPQVLTLPDMPATEIGAAPINRPQFPAAVTNGASGAAAGIATAAVPPVMSQPAIGSPNATAAPNAANAPRVIATLKPAQPAASAQPKAKPYKPAAQPAKPAKPAKPADPLDQIIKLLTTPNGSAPPKPDYGNKK